MLLSFERLLKVIFYRVVEKTAISYLYTIYNPHS